MSTDPLTNVAKQRLGQVLRGKWRLDGLLGIGGMAAVFAATHRNGNRVAIKMLHPQIAIDPSIQQRFLREGYVANSIGHDGAVSVLDDDVTDDGAVFLVMELLEGETLDARAERLGGRLRLPEVISFADQLLDILVAAHGKGIVHRDLKPENLFVTTKGEVKVLDFGIARLLERAGSTAATKTGSMLGTPAFMPPEQALGYVKEVDQQSDIWAVGAVMFTLLTGRTVHSGNTVNEMLIAAATKPVSATITLVPDLPPFLAHILDRALAFDKANRWNSAADMLDAIREATEATVVASQVSVPLAVQTLASAPRTSQVASYPEIGLGSGFGTAAMPGPEPVAGVAPMPGPAPVPMATPPTVTEPVRATSSGMAVGRTLTGRTSVRNPRVSPTLVAIAAGLLLATVVVGVAVLLSRDDSPEAALLVSSASAVTGAATSSAPVRSADAEHDDSLDPSALPVASPARLDIIAQGGTCRITFDGTDKGTTPIKSLEVPPGSHDVRCSSNGVVEAKKFEAKVSGSHTVTFIVGTSKTAPPANTATPAKPPAKTAQPPPQPAKTVNPLDMR